MDIVSRLKLFLETERISISQFADTCRIPRPTLSQLLNGRNKKISDELISKIHSAYPSLSVMWLMFGEGDMGLSGKTQISEAQTPPNIPQFATEEPLQKAINFSEGDVDLIKPNKSNGEPIRTAPAYRPHQQSAAYRSPGFGDNALQFDDAARHESSTPVTSSPSGSAATSVAQSVASSEGNISIVADSSKRITRVLVFYSDHSFQEFLPR